ncbi:hypothetical protein O3M35_011866 [Rhynocoris fuscipes]|uniref:Uncharacterized protein n=1 Tax=Rhynocoris fuscipes TaxID=488301 RepID=A0AAW1CZN9_9HEMI
MALFLLHLLLLLLLLLLLSSLSSTPYKKSKTIKKPQLFYQKKKQLSFNNFLFSLLISSYITREGTIFNEQGKLKKLANDDGEVLIKEGSYQYKSPEGEAISLKYVADEDGFRPEGSHLPVPVQPVQPVFTEN